MSCKTCGGPLTDGLDYDRQRFSMQYHGVSQAAAMEIAGRCRDCLVSELRGRATVTVDRFSASFGSNTTQEAYKAALYDLSGHTEKV